MRVYVFDSDGKGVCDTFESTHLFNKDGSLIQPIRRSVVEAIEKDRYVLLVSHNGPVPTHLG